MYQIFSLSSLLSIGVYISLSIVTGTAQNTIIGFTPKNNEAQLLLEGQFDSHLSSERIRDRIEWMSSQPNHLGSPKQYQNAIYLDSLFSSWGFESQIEEFKVLLPTPAERVLEMIEPRQFRASLSEPALEEDATSAIREGSLPPYNAFATDGDVTAELVYVNRGVPDDYKELEKRGISVEGKIVIARYGGSWRGIKPKVAYEHGAIGCILYSDPIDDGYSVGDPYPVGSWRPEGGVQRGSVMDLPVRPGDPLTPGTGSTPEAPRIEIEESEVILKIPVLPISYADALPLLSAMTGPVAPPSWRGSLPITYHMGPGASKVRLKLRFNWDQVPLYNVIARLEGSTYPDQWIIRGNHMDGWVFGAADPLSGNSAMMEEAFAIGQLVQSGWKPKRTIVFASWDGEEQGLIGSTEWVEKHLDELKNKAVAYINTDGNSRGFLYAGGSHSLQHFVNEIGRSVTDPQTDVSVLKRAKARLMVNGNEDVAKGGDYPLYPLGSGSDYSPFLQHLGISSLNISYGGEGGGGAYHSRYDSYDHYRRFGDPKFEYGVVLSQTTGRALLRLANADIIPHQFEDMNRNIAHYLKEVKDLIANMRKERDYAEKLHKSNSYVLSADPTKPYHPPKLESPIPYLNFAPMENAVARLNEVTAQYDQSLKSMLSGEVQADPVKLKAINSALQSIEQNLTDPDGLPRRPWYRHRIYAPGYYTGYGVKTLPGIREGIEEYNWEEASEQIVLTADAINRYADAIKEITDLFQ